MTDRDGNQLVMHYSSIVDVGGHHLSRLDQVYDPTSVVDDQPTRFIDFHYHTGTNDFDITHVTSVTDFTTPTDSEHIWTFSYEHGAGDTDGRTFLTQSQVNERSDEQLTTTYAYSDVGTYTDWLVSPGVHRNAAIRVLTSITDNNNDGGATTHFDYYPNGKVASTTDPDGNVEFFNYDFSASSPSVLRAEHIDKRGLKTELTLSAADLHTVAGLITKTINPDRTRTSEKYLGVLPLSITDENGIIQTNQYFSSTLLFYGYASS